MLGAQWLHANQDPKKGGNKSTQHFYEALDPAAPLKQREAIAAAAAVCDPAAAQLALELANAGRLPGWVAGVLDFDFLKLAAKG